MAGFDDLADTLRKLAKKRLLIGIPMENDPRPGSKLGNASLGYVHEFGSPARNIPERSFLRAGIEAALPEIEAKMRDAATAAVGGDLAAAETALGNAGEIGVRAVHDRIQAGIKPILKESTVEARRLRRPDIHYRVRMRIVAEEEARKARGGRASPWLREAKKKYGLGKRIYLREAQTPAEATPLIDTSSLLRAVTYVIRDT